VQALLALTVSLLVVEAVGEICQPCFPLLIIDVLP